MEKNKYKKLISNTFVFTIGSVGSKLITFFLVPLHTNVLTKGEYGLADLVNSISNVIVPFLGLVIQDAILRFALSKSSNKGSVIKVAFILFLPGMLLCFCLIPIFDLYPPVSGWGFYIAALSFSSMLYNISFTYAKAKEKNILYSVASILSTLIIASTNILLLVCFNEGVRGYLVANILGLFIPSMVVILATHSLKDAFLAPFDKRLMKEMVLYSLPLIANNLSWWILSSSDKVMIEYFLSTGDLGLYTAASKVPALLTVITTIFASAWTISSIKEYDEGKDKVFFSNVFKYYSLLLFLASLVIIFILKPFMQIYVGADFYDSWRLVPFLIIGAVFYSFGSFFGAIFGALKKNSVCTITTIIAGFINIVVNLVLIPRIGLIAASLSTGISYIAIGVIRMFFSRRYFRFDIDFLRFGINSSVLILCTLFVFLDILNIYIYLLSSLGLLFLILFNFQDLLGLFRFIKIFLMRKKESNETN
jgi:O-antigen/teichoic acid export membrane protein